MKVINITIIFLFFLLTSCIDEWDRYLDTKQLNYNIISASDDFKNYSKIHIEQYKNTLTIRLHIKQLLNLSKKNKDKISVYKRFKFKLFDNNNIIKIDPLFYKYFTGFDFINDTIIGYKSNDCDITKTNEIKFSIPLIYFYKLKNGEHKINLKITTDDENIIDKLKSDKIKQNINIDYRANIIFNLNIPEIYETTICNDSIILQNDKYFSPKGMDFSFREGYPDIYWQIIYNLDNKNYESIKSNHEANYATMYLYKDTISFIHLKNPGKIIIKVMDRDDLSPDDIIGIWKGDINKLESTKNTYKTLKFDHIDKFKIKIIKKNNLIN